MRRGERPPFETIWNESNTCKQDGDQALQDGDPALACDKFWSGIKIIENGCDDLDAEDASKDEVPRREQLMELCL